jgi:hypothetical protein
MLPQLSVRSYSLTPLPLQSERARMPVRPLRDCGESRCSLHGWCTNSSGTARCHCFYGEEIACISHFLSPPGETGEASSRGVSSE